MRTLILTLLLSAGALVTAPEARADAKSDCKIEFDRSDGSTQLAHVKNTNAARAIQVTVSVTETFRNGDSRRLSDMVYDLAPGQRAFCGGTVSGGSQYTYSVAGAS